MQFRLKLFFLNYLSRYNTSMGIILPFLTITFFNILLMQLSKKSFGRLLPLSIIFIGIFSLITSLFNNIFVGYLLYCGFSLFGLIIAIKHHKELFNNNFYLTLLLFILFYIFVTYININKQIFAWDDFTHWAYMVKDMYRTNNLYTSSISTLIYHRDYPPLVSLIELFWIWIKGSYSESYLFRAIQLLEFSFFISIFSEKLQSKNIIKNVISIFIVFIFSITTVILFNLEDAKFYSTLYLDFIMAITAAYYIRILNNYNEFSLFSFFEIFLLSISILFIKQIGIIFIILGLIILLFKLLIKHEVYYLKLILCIIFAYAFSILWSIYIKNLSIAGQFDINLSTIFESFKILIYQLSSNSNVLISNFFNHIYAKPLLFSSSIFSFFYLNIFILLINLFLDKTKRLEISIYLIFLFSFVYIYILFILYNNSFSSYEFENLFSLTRYLNTYLLFSLLYLIFSYINQRIELLNIKSIFILLIVIFISITNNWSNDSFSLNLKPYQVSKIESISNKLNELTTFDQGIFIVAQQESDLITNQFRYYMLPRKINMDYQYISFDEYISGYWEKTIDKEDFINLLLNYDYLYIYSINREFEYFAYSLFDDSNYPVVGGVYKIYKHNTTVNLVLETFIY